MLGKNMAITLQLTGPCFLGKKRLETSYWLKANAAWFLNGPGGHLVTCAVGLGWRRGLGVGTVQGPEARSPHPGQT